MRRAYAFAVRSLDETAGVGHGRRSMRLPLSEKHSELVFWVVCFVLAAGIGELGHRVVPADSLWWFLAFMAAGCVVWVVLAFAIARVWPESR